MIYEEARRVLPEDRKLMRCICPDKHIWYEWFYKLWTYGQYRDTFEWVFASTDGSICPECGQEDISGLLHP